MKIEIFLLKLEILIYFRIQSNSQIAQQSIENSRNENRANEETVFQLGTKQTQLQSEIQTTIQRLNNDMNRTREGQHKKKIQT